MATQRGHRTDGGRGCVRRPAELLARRSDDNLAAAEEDLCREAARRRRRLAGDRMSNAGWNADGRRNCLGHGLKGDRRELIEDWLLQGRIQQAVGKGKRMVGGQWWPALRTAGSEAQRAGARGCRLAWRDCLRQGVGKSRGAGEDGRWVPSSGTERGKIQQQAITRWTSEMARRLGPGRRAATSRRVHTADGRRTRG